MLRLSFLLFAFNFLLFASSSAQDRPQVAKDSNGNVTVTFPTVKGRLYNLEAATDGINFAPVPGKWLYGNGSTASFPLAKTQCQASMALTTPLLHRIVNTYDERGRFETRESREGLLTYAHDDASNLINVLSSTPNGLDLEYTYDALNRLENVYDHGATTPAQAHTYTYDAVGNLESVTSPNQVRHLYTYNSLNRLTDLVLQRSVGILPASTTLLQSYAYTLRPTGHRSQVLEHTGRTVAYTYDKLDRLTNESVTGSGGLQPPSGSPALGSISYALDKVGNRTQRTSTLPGISNQTSTYDDNDRLNGDNYDNNGNTLASNSSLPTHHSSLVSSDTYDFQNRLIQRLYQNGTKIELDYDAQGNRVGKRVLTATTGVSTRYHVNPYNPTGYVQVVEESSTGILPVSGSPLTHTLRRVYAHGNDLLTQSQLLPQSGGGEAWITSTYLYDGHGNTRGLTDETGTVTDTYTYDAFGTIIEQTGTTPNLYLYCGEQWDPDLGLSYNRARYLNLDSGRFWSMDVYEGNRRDPNSLHKYLYVHGDPVQGIDPSGYIETLPGLSLANNIQGRLQGMATYRVLRCFQWPNFTNAV